jgi:Alpha/beta hydrolase domain
MAEVNGPIPGIISLSTTEFALEPVGYTCEEWFVTGTASSYEPDGSGARAAGSAPFATRIVVCRPADPTQFSGTAVVEWLNVSGGRDAAPDWNVAHRHLRREGHAWIGVSAQRVGIEGGGFVDTGQHLKAADPERYESLSHPGDPFSFDIFTQAAELLRVPTPLLGGVAAQRLLASGASQSAMFLFTYIDAVDPLAQVFDGYMPRTCPSRPVPLDANFSRLVAGDLPEPVEVRHDMRVPVLVVNSETEIFGMGGPATRFDDHDQYRLWEIAGAAHADTYALVGGRIDSGALTPEQLADAIVPTATPQPGMECDTPINAGPQQHFIVQAALAHLDRWAGGGDPPPSARRLELDAAGTAFAVDELDIARGGIRSPWVDAPTLRLSGVGQTGAVFASLFGTSRPITPDELAARYPGGQEQYLEEFTASAERARDAGFLLDADLDEILALGAVEAARVFAD